MENENTNQENTPAENSVKDALEFKISQLTSSVETLSSELETIKRNVQKRKSENTTLKILFYTGLIVLLLGFLYSNSTLQRAQMDSLESSIHTLRTLMNREILSVQKNMFGQIGQLEKHIIELSDVNFQGTLDGLDLALSNLDAKDEKTLRLIEQVRKDSKGLREMYSDYKNSLLNQGKKTGIHPQDTEEPETGVEDIKNEEPALP